MAGKSTVLDNFSSAGSAEPFSGTFVCFHLWHCSLRVLFIFAQVSMALFTLEDKDLMIACYDAYNEWLANECARLPGRMYGLLSIFGIALWLVSDGIVAIRASPSTRRCFSAAGASSA